MKNKKVLGMLGIGCAAFLLTGCGGSSNKLNCTMSQEMGEMLEIEAELEVSFDEDWKKITEIDATQRMKITSDQVTDEMIDELMISLEDQCDEKEEDMMNVTKCDVAKNDDTITLVMVGTPSENGSGYLKEEMTKEEAIEAIEEQGFTCK